MAGPARRDVGGAVRVTPVITVTDAPSAEAAAVIGGLLGRTSLGLSFIDLVFLPDEVRGRDVGRSMMRQAEDEAQRRHCRAIVLYTISFQAPGFYERLGYRRFGTIDCDPPGASRIFFVKELAPGAPM